MGVFHVYLPSSPVVTAKWAIGDTATPKIAPAWCENSISGAWL